MRRAVRDLAGFPDDRLFKEVSEGIPLIVQSAIGFDEAAQSLHAQQQFRASELIRGLAEEEAAKVLILIDLVRCPSVPERKMEVVKHYYSHVSKRIYATTCSYPWIGSFKEFSELVQTETRPYYLDGPNQVDWIFPNSIVTEREQALYVDFVQDITAEAGDYFWRSPVPPASDQLPYETPDCVQLSHALSVAGAGSACGLSIIADVWRGFKPEPETDRSELWGLITHTLEQLASTGASAEYRLASNFIVSHWSFPLWPLTIKEPRATADGLEELRQERALTIEWIDATNAKRHPPPAVSRSKVEALRNAYAVWKREVNAQNPNRFRDEEGRVRFVSSSELARDFELPSYKRLEEMFGGLTAEERAGLLALGWYAKERFADWSRTYERAIASVPRLDTRYQIGYVSYWLAGLRRWEKPPQPFHAGQRYSDAYKEGLLVRPWTRVER